uniref:Uncharacterized protein n=1 Tax=Oryza nivara TaxID=4536 RepID=A0A0E0I372_ORYNI
MPTQRIGLGFHPKWERVHKATPPRRKRRSQASMSPILEDQTRLSPKTLSKVGQAHCSDLGTTTGSHRHRTHEAPVRPKSPDNRLTGPQTRTNTSPPPLKGSTAGSRDDQKKGGAPRSEGGVAGMRRN